MTTIIINYYPAGKDNVTNRLIEVVAGDTTHTYVFEGTDEELGRVIKRHLT